MKRLLALMILTLCIVNANAAFAARDSHRWFHRDQERCSWGTWRWGYCKPKPTR